ncbi:hypothetical protein CS022_21945 [Veronia nyctiphanis]|uniref:DUF2834 domain-containing protein n=1 Tax=Veronia nyctiphanis TaxID=1278244 RepID=A0A4Q0YJR6_9GAMM|nr:DUF2834 domain-containing protein [Veronia nyctiphanis]RXJ70856.1 hypothetical protein CS022_21945 [Veronia nyctiphanis]
MKWIYLFFAVIGTFVPFGALLPWLIENGVDVAKFAANITANPISIFAWLDVVIAGVALIVFIVTDSKRNEVKHGYLAILATLMVGVSAGLPLYLSMRCRTGEAVNSAAI